MRLWPWPPAVNLVKERLYFIPLALIMKAGKEGKRNDRWLTSLERELMGTSVFLKLWEEGGTLGTNSLWGCQVLAVFNSDLLWGKTSPNYGCRRTFLLCKPCEWPALTPLVSRKTQLFPSGGPEDGIAVASIESFKASYTQASLLSSSPEIMLNSSKDESKCKWEFVYISQMSATQLQRL